MANPPSNIHLNTVRERLDAAAPVPVSSPIQVSNRKSALPQTASTPGRLVVRSSTVRGIERTNSSRQLPLVSSPAGIERKGSSRQLIAPAVSQTSPTIERTGSSRQLIAPAVSQTSSTIERTGSSRQPIGPSGLAMERTGSSKQPIAPSASQAPAVVLEKYVTAKEASQTPSGEMQRQNQQTSHQQKKSRAEEIATRAVREMAIKTNAAIQIQRFYRNILARRYFSRRVKRGIVRFQQVVRTFWMRRRFLELSRNRAPWKEFLRPNEAVLLTSTVIKTSDVRSFRAVAKQARLKTLFTSKKVRQLVLTTAPYDGVPRLFYVDPATRVWKGEIPYDSALTSALTLTESEFLVFSRPNEEKLDKDPIWSFEVLEGSPAVEWIKAIRDPKTPKEMIVSNSFPATQSAMIDDASPRKTTSAKAESSKATETLLASPVAPNVTPRAISRTDSFTRMRAMLMPLSTRQKVVIMNKRGLRASSQALELQGPLLMRELIGPKRYYQRYFALKGTTLLWSGAGDVNLDIDSYKCGLSLTAACKVRLLTSPKLIPNLPNFAFWLYVPMREKPLKFRTMDMETAEKWVDKLNNAIAKCESITSGAGSNREFDRIRALLAESRDLVDKRSFLSAKVKLKEGLDIVESMRASSSSSSNSLSPAPSTDLEDAEFELLELRARCNFVLGLFEKSLDDVNRALEIVSDDEPCLRIKLVSLEKLERYEECMELVDYMLAEFPTRAKELEDTRERVSALLRESRKLEKSGSFNDLTTLKKRPAIARQNSDGLLGSSDSLVRDIMPLKQTSFSNRNQPPRSPPAVPNDLHQQKRRLFEEDATRQLASPLRSMEMDVRATRADSARILSTDTGGEDDGDEGPSMVVSHVARAEAIMAKRLSRRLSQLRLEVDGSSID